MARTTPCGIEIPASEVMRAIDDFGYYVRTGIAGKGKTGEVFVPDIATIEGRDPGYIHGRVMGSEVQWLAWHDEHCDCRATPQVPEG